MPRARIIKSDLLIIIVNCCLGVDITICIQIRLTFALKFLCSTIKHVNRNFITNNCGYNKYKHKMLIYNEPTIENE